VSYKASADFDNIIVSPDRTIELANMPFAAGDERHWQNRGDGDWAIQSIPFSGDYLYHQESTAGGARSVAGLPETDQVVAARVQPLAFNGADRWVGLMARYVDDNNYYYLTLRSNNTVSLRKLNEWYDHDAGHGIVPSGDGQHISCASVRRGQRAARLCE
jgi:hypothetical protein